MTLADERHRVVVLFDVDDTLLDNDGFERDLRAFITAEAGTDAAARYFDAFEELRAELGYADFIGAFQRYRLADQTQPHLLELSSFMMDYPFSGSLFSGAVSAVDAVRQTHGAVPVILSDGDAVFQPRKIRRAGLFGAVGGRVLVYVHKETMLDDVERRYPADRYVMLDDKLRLLTDVKRSWGPRVATVFVRQGRHARNADEIEGLPDPDHTLEAIGAFPKALPKILAAGEAGG